MSFTTLKNEILAFCYQNETNFKTIILLTKKHSKSIGKSETIKEAEAALSKLIIKKEIKIKTDSDNNLVFTITDLGEKVIENYFVNNGQEEYINCL
ncbi:MAG: hypothetical protein HN576_01280 [Bacteriovoracaceae bacterium]|jgi:predicted transcriptional regulator|nr:hypothetical protein [Bacteriovoracaceae bacterium]